MRPRHVQDLVDRNAFNKGFNGLVQRRSKAQFLNGEAAMYLMGTWELPNYTIQSNAFRNRFRDSIGFFKFPTVDGGKGNIDSWVGGPGVGLFVAENSPVKAEAKKFVKYVREALGRGIRYRRRRNTGNEGGHVEKRSFLSSISICSMK